MRTSKKFLETPALFILLSFLIGLVNFADTALRLFHLYINPGGYPLGFALKPLFFFLQAFCLVGYLTKMRETSKNIDKPVFQGLLKTHLAFSAITIILFLLTATIDLGKTGRIVWLICYVTSLTGTCFWFSAKLAGFSRFRLFSVIFLLIGSVFFLWFVNEIYLLLQTLFGLYLPPIVDRFTLWAPAVLMGITLFYTWIILLIRKRKILSRTSIIKYSVVYISAIIPAIWDSYKDGLLNVIIMAIISWGLKYSGYKWFYVSLYFAIFSVYIFLIKQLIEQLDQTVASYLILLGVVSLPWNGLMVFDQGFSSIPGNLLSINALITGFYLRKTLKEQDK